MQGRPADIRYNGVRPDKIDNANPKLNQKNLGRCLDWIVERYKIHVKKDVLGLPSPWTEDPVLRDHKFTNVRREHDRESKHVIRGICENPSLSMEQKVQNLIMFRMFNVWSTVELIGGPFTNFGSIDLDAVRAKLKVVDGERVFTNAFNCGGLKQCLAFPDLDYVNHAHQRRGGMMVKVMDLPNMAESEMDYKVARDLAQAEPDRYSIEGWEPNMAMRVVRYLNTFFKNNPNWVSEFLMSSTQKAAFLKLNEVRGISEFLGYQIFVDCTYCPEYPFSENEFTIAGPGCKMGLDFIFDDRDGMTYEECIFWLRDHQEELLWDLKSVHHSEFMDDQYVEEQTFSVMSWENVMCETSKYIRCMDALERGDKPRTRVKFNGGASKAPSTTKSVLDLF